MISRPEFPSWSWLSCPWQVSYSPLILSTRNILRTVDGRPYHNFQEFIDDPSAGANRAAGCCTVTSIESAETSMLPQQILTGHTLRIKTTGATFKIPKLKEEVSRVTAITKRVWRVGTYGICMAPTARGCKEERNSYIMLYTINSVPFAPTKPCLTTSR